jgi:hypothetical protein
VPPAVTNDPSVPLQQKARLISLTLPPETPKRMFLVRYCACVTAGTQTKATVRTDSREEILSFIVLAVLSRGAVKRQEIFSAVCLCGTPRARRTAFKGKADWNGCATRPRCSVSTTLTGALALTGTMTAASAIILKRCKFYRLQTSGASVAGARS